MLRKEPKKPLYFEKSKAAKHVDKEYDVYSVPDTPTMNPARERRRKKRSPKRRETEYKEYKYYDSEEKFVEKKYGYGYRDENTYNEESEMYELMTEESPWRQSTFTEVETIYSGESDSDGPRRRRSRRMMEQSEYNTDDYNYRGRPRERRGQRRSRHGRRRRIPQEPSETERSPYGNEYHVYAARQPVGHRAFTYKQQLQREGYMTDSDSEMFTDEEDSDVTSADRRTQPQYEVYAAGVNHNKNTAFDHKRARADVERMAADSKDVPPVKTIGRNESPEKIPSDVVYLPVILRENIGKTNGKTISVEAPSKDITEKRERAIDTNMQVYAATDINHANIFAKANNNTNVEPSPTNNITINTAEKDQTSTATNKKSTASSPLEKTTPSKSDILQSQYPVQKSYINVAPSKLKPSKTGSRRSRSSYRKRASSVSPRSLAESSTAGDQKRRGFFRRILRRDTKTDKERKKLSKTASDQSSGSVVLSVVDPIQRESDENIDSKARNADVIYKTIVVNKSKSPQDETTESQITKDIVQQGESLVKVHQPIPKSTSDDKKDIAKESRASKVDGQVPSMGRRSLARELSSVTRKSEREGVKKPFDEGTNQRFTIKSESVMQPQREKSEQHGEPALAKEPAVMMPGKPSTSKLFRKKKDHPIKHAESKEFEPKTGRKVLQSIEENQDPHTFSEKEQLSSHTTTAAQVKQRESKIQREESQRRVTLVRKPTEEYIDEKTLEQHMKPDPTGKPADVVDTPQTADDEEHPPLIVFGYDLVQPLRRVFAVAQFFLGVSIHDVVLEGFRTFKGDY